MLTPLPSPLLSAALMAVVAAPFAESSARAAEGVRESGLQQLFQAERYLSDFAGTPKRSAGRHAGRGTDITARRATEKRRQKAKQSARRLKAARS